MTASALVIPLYKQSKYCNKMLTGLQKQTVKPDIIYLVVDRPEDDKGPLSGSGEPEYDDWDAIYQIQSEIDKFPELNVEILAIHHPPKDIQRKSEGPLFLAGMARNVGLEAALRRGCHTVIFIDGDCIPEPDLVKSHLNKCNTYLPTLTVGRRREQQYRWQDRRESISSLAGLQMFRSEGLLIGNTELFRDCLVVWSCNFAVNLPAIKLIKKFNSIYYNRSEFFNSNFLGAWGGEDSFLGIEAWFCRIFVTTIGERRSGVQHINHPRPPETHTIKHKEFFDSQVDKLKKKVRLKPLGLDFFIQAQ